MIVDFESYIARDYEESMFVMRYECTIFIKTVENHKNALSITTIVKT